MMFVVLTYHNQSIRSSFSELLSFVTNSPVAEEALSGSTDVGLFVYKAMYSFSRLFDLFFVASKRHISFITICDRISSCAGVVLWSSLSRITWILCFISNGWLNVQCLKYLLLYNGAQMPLWCLLSLIIWEVAISFWVSLVTNLNWMRMDLVVSKRKPNILLKVIANWKGMNRFCKESQLLYELANNSLYSKWNS